MMDESGRWYIGDDVATVAFKSGPKAAAAARNDAVAATSQKWSGGLTDELLRELLAWLSDRTPSVKTWGAAGDGSTDDSAAFVKAASAINGRGGGPLLVPDAVYRVKDVTLPCGVWLVASGEQRYTRNSDVEILGHRPLPRIEAADGASFIFKIDGADAIQYNGGLNGLSLDGRSDDGVTCEGLVLDGSVNGVFYPDLRALSFSNFAYPAIRSVGKVTGGKMIDVRVRDSATVDQGVPKGALDLAGTEWRLVDVSSASGISTIDAYTCNASSVTGSTIVLPSTFDDSSAVSTTDGTYTVANGWVVEVTSAGANGDQLRFPSGYAGSTRTLTIAAFAGTPTGTIAVRLWRVYAPAFYLRTGNCWLTNCMGQLSQLGYLLDGSSQGSGDYMLTNCRADLNYGPGAIVRWSSDWNGIRLSRNSGANKSDTDANFDGKYDGMIVDVNIPAMITGLKADHVTDDNNRMRNALRFVGNTTASDVKVAAGNKASLSNWKSVGLRSRAIRMEGPQGPAVTTPRGGYLSFAAGDTTPSVQDWGTWRTANASATTITAFDDGFRGQEIDVLVNDANTTFDFTSTTLKGNGGVDYAAASGDRVRAVYDGTNWSCMISKVA